MDFNQIDLSDLFTLQIGLAIVGGTTIGLIVGALPGLGSVVALVLMLPFTFVMDPLVAILLLLATYQAAEYGGSISSIVLGIPGTAAAVATREDGLPLAKKGKPGKALGISLIASTLGGLVGGLVLLLVSDPITEIALQFSSPEFVLIALLGLVGLAVITASNLFRMIISMALGLITSTIGIDMFTGQSRFTGGLVELSTGVSLVVVMIGLFAIAEVLNMIEARTRSVSVETKGALTPKLPLKEIPSIGKASAIGAGIGSIIGVFPGMGAGVASWFAYGSAKRLSRRPQEFGNGSPEGIAAPEAANNAVVGTSMVPLLTLGVPGSATVAIVLGAFIMQGIQPGPLLFESDPDLVYGILFGFLLTTIALFIMARFLTPWFARIVTVPPHILVPSILLLSILGVYASSALLVEVWLAIGLGTIVYLILRFDFSTSGFILAFILGPLIEENFRRAMIQSDGSLMIFLARPWSAGLVAVMSAMVLLVVVSTVWKRIKRNRGQADMKERTNERNVYE